MKTSKWLCTASSLAAVALAAPPVLAQDAPAAAAAGGVTSSAPAASDQQVGGIVVTGSRIARNDYVAESPVVTVNQDLIQNNGTPALEQTIDTLPQFNGSATSQAVAGGSTGLNSGVGRATINLRGLGPQRTLVLVDGQRQQPSDTLGSIDLNTISSALIDNVEIITGGASAVYGSDAVAGVVNLKLKKHFSGLMVDAQYSEPEIGDGGTTSIDTVFGGDFAGDKGNAVFSLSYYNRGQILRQNTPFFDGPLGLVTSPSGTCCFSNGIVIDDPSNLWNAKAIPGGGALAANNSGAIGFNVSDGSVFLTTGAHNNFNSNGQDGFFIDPLSKSVTQRIDYGSDPTQSQTPMQRWNGFGRVYYDLTDHVTAYAQFNYTRYNVQSDAPGVLMATQYPIEAPVSNPYVQADPSLLALLNSRPAPNAPFQYYFTANRIAPLHYDVGYNVDQLTLGFKGDVPNTSFTWEVYGSNGRTQELDEIDGYESKTAFYNLIDAPDGGSSLCSGGYNLFALAPVSQACSTYLTRNILNRTVYGQDDLEAQLNGDVFNLPAGTVKFSAGVDWRKDTYDYRPDNEFLINYTPPAENVGFGSAAALQTDAFGTFGQSSSQGSESVKEGSLELLVPVLKDLPFAKSVNLDVAYRYSDYDRSGGSNTYKASVDWAFNDMLLFRGGYQRAIRAPSVGQLFQALQSYGSSIGRQTQGLGDPCDHRWAGLTGLTDAQHYGAAAIAAHPGDAAGAAADPTPGIHNGSVEGLCVAQGLTPAAYSGYEFSGAAVGGFGLGNAALVPEVADSWTGGFVVKPSFPWKSLSRIQASVDFYDIKLDKAIGPLRAQVAVPACFDGDKISNPTYDPNNYYCQQIGRIAGVITTVNEQFQNLGGYHTQGVDLELDASVHAEDFGWADRWGLVKVNFVGTYVDKYEIQTGKGAPFINYAGTIGDSTIDPTTISHPKWKHTLNLTYVNGPLSVNTQWRFIGSMDNAGCFTAAGRNPACTAAGTSARSYIDLTGRYELPHKTELRAGINNLFDRLPPFYTGEAAVDASTFDVIGRRYFVGLQKTF